MTKASAEKPDTRKHAKLEKAENRASGVLTTEIARAIGSAVPQDQRRQIVTKITRVIKTNEHFLGPIAHPRHLREYEDILPGSAERIVSMAEKQQCHEHEMERAVLTKAFQIHKYAMFLGFMAFIILVCLAAYAGMRGNNVLAGMFLSAVALGGAATLIRGWKTNTQTEQKD